MINFNRINNKQKNQCVNFVIIFVTNHNNKKMKQFVYFVDNFILNKLMLKQKAIYKNLILNLSCNVSNVIKIYLLINF